MGGEGQGEGADCYASKLKIMSTLSTTLIHPPSPSPLPPLGSEEPWKQRFVTYRPHQSGC